MVWTWLPERSEERRGKGPVATSWRPKGNDKRGGRGKGGGAWPPLIQGPVRSHLGVTHWGGSPQKGRAGGAAMPQRGEGTEQRHLTELRRIMQTLARLGSFPTAMEGIQAEEKQLAAKLFLAQPPSERLKDLEIRYEKDAREVEKQAAARAKAQERVRRATEAEREVILAEGRAGAQAAESKRQLDEMKASLASVQPDRTASPGGQTSCTQASLVQALQIIVAATQNTGVTLDKSVGTLCEAMRYQLETPTERVATPMERAGSDGTSAPSVAGSKRQRTERHDPTGSGGKAGVV